MKKDIKIQVFKSDEALNQAIEYVNQLIEFRYKSKLTEMELRSLRNKLKEISRQSFREAQDIMLNISNNI